MLLKKTNHVNEALGNLITKFKDKDNFTTFLTALVNQIQLFEDAAFEVFEDRWLLTAEGAQLDGLGRIFDIGREGRDDDDYRIAIIQKIQIIFSRSTAEDIITALRNFWTAVYRLEDLGFADLRITMEDRWQSGISPAISDFLALIDSVNAAGVGSYFQYSTVLDSFRFEFASGDTPEIGVYKGFGNDAQTTGGIFDAIEEV